MTKEWQRRAASAARTGAADEHTGVVLGDPVTLYADYCDWPLWGPLGNLSEDSLPISDALKDRIRAWFNFYDKPRPGWPLWVPPAEARGDEIERAWVAEGDAIRRELENELGHAVAFEV